MTYNSVHKNIIVILFWLQDSTLSCMQMNIKLYNCGTSPHVLGLIKKLKRKELLTFHALLSASYYARIYISTETSKIMPNYSKNMKSMSPISVFQWCFHESTTSHIQIRWKKYNRKLLAYMCSPWCQGKEAHYKLRF